ncbi:helix-turn-helix domain-containing protein [Arthrobacter psychrochitiniphilus]|uniref:helix-turn-helix domain-containing protein n=1 Tax=Arthrobacter psychrochitiniphilus TaxID=291045 RepID=UPI003F7B920E
MSKDKGTREYVAKRIEDGKSKNEIIRCLKRYVAREIYRVMKNPRPAPLTNDLRSIRLAMGLTKAMADAALGTWPTAISRIERGKCRDLQVISEYRVWLQKQSSKSN